MNKLLSIIIGIASLSISSNVSATHSLYSCAEPSQDSITRINHILDQANVINSDKIHYNSVRNQQNSDYHMSLETIRSPIRPKEFLEYTPASTTYAKENLRPNLLKMKELISKVTFIVEDVSVMGTWVALNLKPDLDSVKGRDKSTLRTLLQGRPHLSIAKFDLSSNNHTHSATLLVNRIKDLIKRNTLKISFDKASIYAPCLSDFNNGSPIYENKRILTA